jgi:quinol-cytochrome oxidoreductase complex cytochrome b subunit
VLLFGITMIFGFSGYLLPWHQIAVNATKIGLQTIEELGQYLPGQLAHLPRTIRETIQGEATVGQATLSRFFAIHVILLPLAMVGDSRHALVSVQLHGMSAGVDERRGAGRSSSRLLHQGPAGLGRGLHGAVHTGGCLPFRIALQLRALRTSTPPGSTPDGIKPEWYFFWIHPSCCRSG